MEFLDRLQRQRYMVLRGLRVARANLEAQDLGHRHERQLLDELIEFLRDFVVGHFFAREDALLAAYDRHRGAGDADGELFLLRHEHRAGRVLLDTLQAARDDLAESHSRVRREIAKVITKFADALIRGELAVQEVEGRLGELPPDLRAALEEAVPDDAEVTERFTRLLGILEAEHPELLREHKDPGAPGRSRAP